MKGVVMLRRKRFFMMLLTMIFATAMVSCNEVKETETTEEMKQQDKQMMGRVAILVAEGFHDGEAYMPMGFLLNQGYEIMVIGPEVGTVKSYNSDFTIEIGKSVRDVSPDDFDALILPGGKGPALLREIPEVLDFVTAFNATGKTIAAICHGPQVLITAGLVNGMTCTGVEGIQGELEDAGAVYIDQSLVKDGNLITSRVPKDLYDFSKAIAEALANKQM
jgi:protease I